MAERQRGRDKAQRKQTGGFKEARSEKAERLAFLGTVAAGLAHELRNPLSTLSMNLQLLKEDWQNPITPKELRTSRAIDVLLEEARRLEQVLNDFLRFAGALRIERRATDLNQLMDGVLDFVEPGADRLGITVRRIYEKELDRLLIDPNYLKQAFLNLVRNAQEAMPGGGELIVRTARVGDMAQVELTDTGKGIPPEEVENILQAYYSTKEGGSGLGLPMARRIIEQHGGELHLESEVGKGTKFMIRLPFGERS